MDIETTARTIQLILAPVVMLSACGLLLNGMWGHYGTLNERIRRLAGERLHLALDPPTPDGERFARERVAQVEHQVPQLLQRHRLVHHAIISAYVAVAVFVVSMFVIAVAALAESDGIGTIALVVFLAGTAALMTSVLFMVTEVRRSHLAVGYEAAATLEVPVPWMDGPAR